MKRRPLRALAVVVVLPWAAACAQSEPEPAERPSILLVTLDTTRADAVGPGAPIATPAFDALAARGVRFTQAYATSPQTLPSHTSMLTGLYPGGHGVHDNGRRYDGRAETAAERLHARGYATAAFVSGFPLERRFGLERGFERYDDELGSAAANGGTERAAADTTARALDYLASERRRPLFLWVHYYDPHEPYDPPEPLRSRHPDDPYHAEVAAMDAELGRLVAAFETETPGGARLVVAGDHGEALGEHGERFHGNLLYQGVMRVPLVVMDPGAAPAVRDQPVSLRRVFDTLLEWTGGADDAQRAGGRRSLLARVDEPALGEAMQPYLLYGWQPQVMAVAGSLKAIRAGGLEVYDLRSDPAERRDLAAEAQLEPALRQALREYPLPDRGAPAPAAELDRDAREKLATLGYVASGAPPQLRPDAPRPRDMTHLFPALDLGSGLFVREEYAKAIPVFAEVLAQDPGNFSVALRLAAAHSALGHAVEAEALFERAAALEPDSLDLALYRGLHQLRGGDWRRAAPRLERVVAAEPQRLAALRGLARARRLEGRVPEAMALLERAIALESDPGADLLELGALAMSVGDTAAAISAYERARALDISAFEHDLELGVLYLAARRLDDAAAALERVPHTHPEHPLALFKRAQVAVLRHEPDAAERIALARRGADDTTRALIASERLFAGY